MRSTSTASVRKRHSARNLTTAARPPRRSAPRSAASLEYLAGPSQTTTEVAAPNTPLDGIELLRQDHRRIQKLLNRLVRAEGSEQPMILWQVEEALRAHTAVEEKNFYPAFRDAAHSEGDRQRAIQAATEHAAIDTILTLLGEAEEHEFAARAKVLSRAFQQHSAEEERTMLARARKLMRPEDLNRIAAELFARHHSNDRHSQRYHLH